MTHPNSEFRRIEGHDDKLLVCPFCGAAAELWEQQECEEVFSKGASCSNSECDMYMPGRDFYKATKGDAIKAWNRRALFAQEAELKAAPNYKRMFEAAVLQLADISVALGIPDEEAEWANGNELILAAIAEIKAARAVPEGWRLVPARPTIEMQKAGGAAARQHLEQTGRNNIAVIYRAMLSAAPQSPQGLPTDEAIERALKAVVCEGETVASHLNWGFENDSPQIRKIMIREVVRTILAAAPQPAAPADHPQMPEGWRVEVSDMQGSIISIEDESLAGREIGEIEEFAIIGAARHLLSFVGYGLPPSTFDPDEAAPVPLSEEQLYRAAGDQTVRSDFFAGARFAEQHHGIAIDSKPAPAGDGQ